MDASALQLIIPVAGIAAVLFALYLARDVLGRFTLDDIPFLTPPSGR